MPFGPSTMGTCRNLRPGSNSREATLDVSLSLLAGGEAECGGVQQ